MTGPNSITLKFSILLIVILAFGARETTCSIFPTPTHVTIKNNISPHPTPIDLTVHCKSKDDDLGFHTLKFGGTYTFSFRPIVFPIFKNTLFFCGFTWPKNPHRHYLDIYDQALDRCKFCNWKINQTGGIKIDTDGKEYFYEWKSIDLIDANSPSKI
ncbi:unnamed protein product [Trifolium pratense]|uniref:Uncharacterized protein n=1 Tax=Trifolium pratense TaxID=57577 RepID=A0ACB0LLE5_TRIPR|nr:unnamed protein product [Trifolium pratense]